MASRYFLGRLSARFTPRQLLTTSNAVSIAMCIAMAFAPNPWVLGAVVFIAGFSLGVGHHAATIVKIANYLGLESVIVTD